MTQTRGSGGIACIGWGSLVYEARDLPCSAWRYDGPLLPVEFARESGGKRKSDPGDRITLVICPDVPRVPTCWALLDVPDMQTARHRLARREYADATDAWTDAHTGFWDHGTGASYGLEAETIGAWASARGFAGAVWTHLDYGFKASRNVMPEGSAVVAFLRNLDAQKQPEAERYVRCAPAQIDTPYRRLIERELGWHRKT